MTSGDSITHWIGQLKEGDEAAAQQELWDRYFRRLTALARKLLRGTPQRAEDEEDVVLAALDSFFRGARGGRFPRLHDRMDLWPLLVKITARKAVNQIQKQRAQKRGGGNVRGESVFTDWAGDDTAGIEQIVGTEPTPDFAAQVAEQCEHLLTSLEDESLRAIARLKLEGYTNPEISEKIGVVERTVERRLRRIRREWSDGVNLE